MSDEIDSKVSHHESLYRRNVLWRAGCVRGCGAFGFLERPPKINAQKRSTRVRHFSRFLRSGPPHNSQLRISMSGSTETGLPTQFGPTRVVGQYDFIMTHYPLFI
jgi:hypothetical protein